MPLMRIQSRGHAREDHHPGDVLALPGLWRDVESRTTNNPSDSPSIDVRTERVITAGGLAARATAALPREQKSLHAIVRIDFSRIEVAI